MVVLGEHRLAAWTYMTMGAQGCVDSPGWPFRTESIDGAIIG